ncbi:GroES-like protein [Fomitiporia mediterranea MF3/22]|uniref:GroES-like protein n=1 Tax=Fomitiporia mediterranea (strain MF3/22) TaxID=694068 RepID=UPI0004408A32|nr:GroES-like protein [Fomitiporia mediterranea MF3/22]EJD07038.1 GroES-like protein [Fomitiporia mediterranea MF3/22]
MAEQKALLLETPKGELRVRQIPIPKPGPGELLVKIHATALNPIDQKRRDTGFLIHAYPAILGLDAAGIVEALGEGTQGFAKGDRVAYEGHVFSNDKATFQQYSTVPAEIAVKLPENISFDEAASIPLCIATAAVGLYSERPEGVGKYTPCWEEGGEGLYRGKPIVIFGGSSSVGQFGKRRLIQFARLSGFSPIITTASLHNSEFLKSLGANYVVDRKADVPAKVKEILGDTLVELVYDSVSEKDTQPQAWEVLSPGGTLVLVRRDVHVDKNKGKTVIDTIFADFHGPELRQFGASLQSKLTRLLENGTIKPNRVEVLPNGLAGISDGLDRIKENKVSGIKLVSRPFETV